MPRIIDVKLLWQKVFSKFNMTNFIQCIYIYIQLYMIIMTMIIVFLVLCDGDPTLLGARMGLQENDQKGGCFSESYMASIVYLSVAFVSVIFLDMIST